MRQSAEEGAVVMVMDPGWQRGINRRHQQLEEQGSVQREEGSFFDKARLFFLGSSAPVDRTLSSHSDAMHGSEHSLAPRPAVGSVILDFALPAGSCIRPPTLPLHTRPALGMPEPLRPPLFSDTQTQE